MQGMNWTILRNHLLTFLAVCAAFGGSAVPGAAIDSPRIINISDAGTVVAGWQGKEATLEKGQSLGQWVLMAVIQPEPRRRLAVFEDFSQTNGHLLFADEHGVKVDLPKSSEPTWADPKTLYRGHRLEDVFNS